MTKQVDAVYENGILRPLEPLLLQEQQRVTLIVSDRCWLDLDYMDAIRQDAQAIGPVPTREEILAMTSKDPAPWGDAIAAEREERL